MRDDSGCCCFRIRSLDVLVHLGHSVRLAPSPTPFPPAPFPTTCPVSRYSFCPSSVYYKINVNLHTRRVLVLLRGEHNARVYADTHARTHTHTHTRAHAHTLTIIYVCVCVCTDVDVYIYREREYNIHIYIYIYRRACTHTDIHARATLRHLQARMYKHALVRVREHTIHTHAFAYAHTRARARTYTTNTRTHLCTRPNTLHTRALSRARTYCTHTHTLARSNVDLYRSLQISREQCRNRGLDSSNYVTSSVKLPT